MVCGEVSGQASRRSVATGVARQTSISTAIIALNREARAAWAKDKKWPRDQMNFATDKNWAVPSESVATALGRQLNKNPAIDGYIKWQLLSFNPTLADLKPQTFNQLVARTPDPLDQPTPEVREPRGSSPGRVFMAFGTQQSYISDLDPVVANGAVAYNPRVSTITSGLVLDVEGAASPALNQVRRVNDQLAAARDMVGEANRAIVAYREELINKLEVDGATRLGLIFKDVRARIRAGEPSYTRAMAQLVTESKRLGRDESITPKIRGTLLKWSKDLAEIETPVVNSVDLDLKGGLKYDVTRMAIAEDDILKVMANLQP
ncbi:MAG: hypothetical protein ACYTGQ_12590 [Planctomycetota bacterium]